MQALLQTDVGSEEQNTAQQWLADACLAGQEYEYAGKRHYQRTTWQVPITVEILDGTRAGEHEYAMARDISESGMGFRCRRAVPVWSLVRITVDQDGSYVHAQVKSCTDTIGGFLIGVEFKPQQQLCPTIRKSA